MLLIIWFAVDAPKPKVVYYDSEVIYSCSSNSGTFQTGMLWSLFAFNSVFILAGAFLAFKARNVATDFNESKYIAFSLYNVIAISVLFVPLISISGLISSTSRFVMLSMMIIIITSFTVLTLFVPKIYHVWEYTQTVSSSSPKPRHSHSSEKGERHNKVSHSQENYPHHSNSQDKLPRQSNNEDTTQSNSKGKAKAQSTEFQHTFDISM